MTFAAELDSKLDNMGMGARIALMVIGFIIWWPLGLAFLTYLIWSGRMGCWSGGQKSRWKDEMERFRSNATSWGSQRSSGNRAFDEYREETLRRLEEEQREFKSFLERLRHAKDKAEFDQFMGERRNVAAPQA